MNKKIIAGLFLVPLYSGVLLAEEGSYTLGVGADYSSGDYGTGDDVTLWSMPFSLSYKADSWGWGITVPYLLLHSKGNVVVGSGGLIGSGGSLGSGTGTGSGPGPGGGGGGGLLASNSTEQGIGDVTLRGSLRLAEEGRVMPWLGITLKAKIATADEDKLLGTGENDYAVQLEMAKGIVDGYVGYKYLGDPAYVDFNNVAYGAVALTHESSMDTSYAIEGYTEQAVIDGNDPKREVSLILNHWFNDRQRISGYVLKGFSDASPDWGAGVVLRHSL